MGHQTSDGAGSSRRASNQAARRRGNDTRRRASAVTRPSRRGCGRPRPRTPAARRRRSAPSSGHVLDLGAPGRAARRPAVGRLRDRERAARRRDPGRRRPLGDVPPPVAGPPRRARRRRRAWRTAGRRATGPRTPAGHADRPDTRGRPAQNGSSSAWSAAAAPAIDGEPLALPLLVARQADVAARAGAVRSAPGSVAPVPPPVVSCASGMPSQISPRGGPGSAWARTAPSRTRRCRARAMRGRATPSR